MRGREREKKRDTERHAVKQPIIHTERYRKKRQGREREVGRERERY